MQAPARSADPSSDRQAGPDNVSELTPALPGRQAAEPPDGPRLRPAGAVAEPGQAAFNRRLASAVRALPAALVILDEEGRIRYFNAAATELLGPLHAGSLWRQTVLDLLAPRWDDGHDLSLKNGRSVHVATQAISEPPGQVLLLTDTTAQRRFNGELSRARRLAEIGQMAAGLAHQIRTPLAAAMLDASQMAGTPLAAAQRARTGARLMERLAHLERLVEDTLLFARCGAVEREPVELVALLRRLAAAAGEACGPDYRLEVRAACGELWILANEHTLASALQNLVDNAVDAAGGAGRLLVEAGPAGGGSAEILLTDDGPGVPAAEAARIFDPFVSRSSGGTGLGLAVVRAVVQAHGGEIALDSGHQGGARFRIHLPLAAGRQAAPEDPSR